MGEDAVPVGPAKTLLEELRQELGLAAGVACPALEDAARAIGERLVCPFVVRGLIQVARGLTAVMSNGKPHGVAMSFIAVWSVHCQGVAIGGVQASRPVRSAWWDGEIAKIEAMAAGRSRGQ